MRRTASAKQGLKKGAWSSEEDQLLINYINQHGHRNWRSLPKNAGLQRRGSSCKRRWTNYLAGEMGRTPCCDNQGLKKRPLSSKEDEILINYINQHGHGTWRSLPKKAGLQRRGNSCWSRWTNCPRPGVKHDPFTPEEENLVIQLHTILGNRTTHPLPYRDKQGLKKGPWSPEEDELLINYINEHGHGNWTSLAKNAGLQGLQRSGGSCRLRWTNFLAREMGRTTCRDKQGLNKGPWSSEEDELLINYINEHGHGNWTSVAKNAGLLRCGVSCMSRWTKYLRPDLKHGPFTPEEENLVIQLHTTLGNRWSVIAMQLPGRTDNAIKNLCNTRLQKQLVTKGLDPQTHEPTSKERGSKPPTSPSNRHMAQWESARLEAEARLSEESLIYNPHSSSSSYSDVFLPLWKSERSTCQSPVSETSSSTKCASSSGPTQRDEDIEVKEDSESHIQLLNARSNSSGSDVVDDSSVFLDFPEDNDTSFLENDIDDYLVYPSDSSND